MISNLNLIAKKSAKTDDHLRCDRSKMSTTESSNSFKVEEAIRNNHPIPSPNPSEFFQTSADSKSQESCNDVQKTQKLFVMYFCILLVVLVVAGIVAGIGIHFACLPNQNSREKINILPTGELKTSLTARNF